MIMLITVYSKSIYHIIANINVIDRRKTVLEGQHINDQRDA